MKRLSSLVSFAALGLVLCSCGAGSERGIADKRSDFAKFIPMTSDPARDGLKEVKPYFASANRGQIEGAIQRACQGEKAGSSVFDERSGRGYYVNCNPRNRQLLNGYVPSDAHVRPHSR